MTSAPQLQDDRKLFDLAEAQRTLPLVSRIVRDIVDVSRRLRESYREAKELVARGKIDEAVAVQDRLQQLLFERSEYIEEVEELGIEVKDADSGLVDYPARLEDRVVYLCWKHGEAAITHWHELDAGFAGRQPVDERFSK